MTNKFYPTFKDIRIFYLTIKDIRIFYPTIKDIRKIKYSPYFTYQNGFSLIDVPGMDIFIWYKESI